MVTALPGTCCALWVTTCWHSRRLRFRRLCHGHICVVVLFVLALCQTPSCTAWPFIFWGSSLANGNDFIVPRSAPVLTAVRAFITVCSAMRVVTGVVHSHFTSGLGTRVTTRKDLSSSPGAQIPTCSRLVEKIYILRKPTSKQLLHSRTSSGYVDLR